MGLAFLRALGAVLRPLVGPLGALASWAAHGALKAAKAPRGSPKRLWLLLGLVLVAAALAALGGL